MLQMSLLFKLNCKVTAAAPTERSPGFTNPTARFVAPVIGVILPVLSRIPKLIFAVRMSPRLESISSRIVAASVSVAVLLVAVGVHA